MSFLVALVVGAIVFAILIIATYNKLVSLRQNVRESWSAIDTELRRRFDLIPNLVETVKGYAAHERQTLEDVVAARTAVKTATVVEDQVNAQNALSGALGRLIALSEAYPDLKANNNFNHLQEELRETETRISQARRFYNANVKEFNTACETFPSSLIASTFNFRPQPYYGIEDPAAFEPVRIDFSPQDSGSVISLDPTKVRKPQDR